MKMASARKTTHGVQHGNILLRPELQHSHNVLEEVVRYLQGRRSILVFLLVLFLPLRFG